MDKYKIAIVCRNGHLITEKSSTGDTSSEKFCSICGAENISVCDVCAAPIRGELDMPGAYMVYPGVPAYCIFCGNPYPWIDNVIEKTKYLISLDEILSDEDKLALVNSTVSILSESNTTAIDVSIFKKLTEKASKFVRDALYKFTVDVASETAKKLLFPDK